MCACTCGYLHISGATCESHKRVLKNLDLEFQTIGSYHMGAELCSLKP